MSLRIGIMLRHLNGRDGGVMTYTRELLRAMLKVEPTHEYVYLCQNAGPMAGIADDERIEKVVLPGRFRLWWDQVEVPRAIRRHGIDVLFNPKFSTALAATCPTSWVCHGLDWYVMPWASRFQDTLSHSYLVPHYARKADVLIAVSDATREHVLRYLRLPPERVRTIYSGVSDLFREPADASRQQALRRKLNLPERFVLYVGDVYPPKNFRRLVHAYAAAGPKRDVGFVIAGGESRFLSEDEVREPERLGLDRWLRRPGWLDQRDLAVLYSMADGLLMPSTYEACPLPLIEAMAAGCPILTSNCFGSAEISGNAALQVDPLDVTAITAGLEQLLDDPGLRASLVDAGRRRAASFSWTRCASETLNVLETIADNRRAR